MTADSIVEYIGRFVALKQAGTNHFGICPFHEEKTPSFVVNDKKGIFHCFGCKKGGTLLVFKQLIRGRLH